jgi:hypothetical protein
VRIFYSWQSWSPRKTNWNFIQDSIEAAIKRIKADGSLEVEPVLDRDTQGKTGSIAIAETIFQKIDECQIFICDVTIVTDTDSKRLIPNPNVLIELGYAAKTIGWENIICVVNEAFGSVEQMPFDLKHRRLLTYSLKDGEEKAGQRQQLADKLYHAIRPLVEQIRPTQSKRERVEQLLADGGRIELEKLLRAEQEAVFQKVQTPEFYTMRQQALESAQNETVHWSKVVPVYAEACHDFFEMIIAVTWHGQSQYNDMIKGTLLRLINDPTDSEQKTICWRFIPSLMLLYIVGTVSVRQENWELARISLLPGKANLRGENRSGTFLHAIVQNTFEVYERVRRVIPHEPLGIYLEKHLRPLFLEYLPSDHEFRRHFDIFEMLLSLMSLKQSKETERYPMGLLPTVAESARDRDRTEDERIEFWQQGGNQNEDWALLLSGLLGRNITEIQGLLAARQTILQDRNKRYDFPAYLPDYLDAYNIGLK